MSGAVDWRIIALVALVGWAALAALARWIASAPIRGDDLEASICLRIVQVYARVVHGLRVSGAEHIPVGDPAHRPPGALIVVANHTAGVDPLLIQAALPYEVRWIMAQDMRVPALERFWQYARIIFIDREKRDSRGLREALRHLKAGGVVGVFPEGHIERPARALLPFEEGAGFLIAKSGASVLPVVVDGTPEVDPAWASLVRPSRSTLRFLPLWRPASGQESAAGAALRELFHRATGWELNERRIEFKDGEWWYITPDGVYVHASEIESRS